VLLALAATALVALALLSELLLPRAAEAWRRLRAARQKAPQVFYDPGRELRAEQRARELLRSCVNREEWEMYRDLGFVRVWGRQAGGPAGGQTGDGVPYGYLIYPHRPVVAFLAQTHRLLGEYCITFPDQTRPYGSARLPDSDDVLAKWMALTGDESRVVAIANLHLPGRQLDPDQVRRDLWRLGQWERRRMRELRARGKATGAPADGA
jgi:hypothetical protein